MWKITLRFHTDVDASMFDKLPLESASSSVSSLVTLASPGMRRIRNGLVSWMGDHAQKTSSCRWPAITDQQSKSSRTRSARFDRIHGGYLGRAPAIWREDGVVIT